MQAGTQTEKNECPKCGRKMHRDEKEGIQSWFMGTNKESGKPVKYPVYLLVCPSCDYYTHEEALDEAVPSDPVELKY